MKSDTQKNSEIEAAEVFEIKTLVENYPETTQSVPFILKLYNNVVYNYYDFFLKDYSKILLYFLFIRKRSREVFLLLLC